MKEAEDSYVDVLKNTISYALIKLFEVAINFIRIKIIAILLGPSGVGIQAVFQSTLSTITQFSSFGIFQTSVRELSQVSSDSQDVIQKLLLNLQRWSWALGIFSMLICLCLASYLSKGLFNDYGYSWQFMFLAIASLFSVLANLNISVLQGLRQVSQLAKASVVSALFSLILTIPVYWLFGEKGIVPGLILSYFSLYIITLKFKKVPSKRIEDVSILQTFSEGKVMIRLGDYAYV